MAVFLASCVPAEVEPVAGGPGPATTQEIPTPFPSATAPATAQVTPPATATAWDQQLLPPTPTVSDQDLQPHVTPTPVPPPPGLVYIHGGELWQVGVDWQPALLATEDAIAFSQDGQRALRIVENDIWLVLLSTGQRFNLTGNSSRIHCCASFWPGRADTIVFGSWSPDDDLGPSSGYLSSAKVDLSEYRVLDEEIPSNGLAAPAPDGQTIAYDRAGTAWLYDWDNGPRALDLAAYGLGNVVRIGGPAWSPDGRQLAWTAAIADPEWRIVVVVFDLGAGTAKLFHPYENVGRGGWFQPPAWSPDGRYLAFVAEDADTARRGVWVVDVESGAESYLGTSVRPVWSPDGRWLLVTPIDDGQSTTGPGAQLIETETWYPLEMYLPPGAQVVDWLP